MHFVITGLPRSGTTFICNLLNSIKEINCAYQPLSDIYLSLLHDFKKKEKIDFVYPADEKPLSRHHELKFHQYLNKKKITKKSIKSNYKNLADRNNNYKFYLNLENFYKINLKKNSKTSINGSKEILIEDYISFFLKKKIKVIAIIREPHDYIFSILSQKKYINYNKYGIEFFIKKYLKILKIYKNNINNKNFLVIKLENLLMERKNSLKKILSFLKYEKIVNLDNLKLNQNKYNSSYQKKLKPFDTRVIGNGKFLENKIKLLIDNNLKKKHWKLIDEISKRNILDK